MPVHVGGNHWCLAVVNFKQKQFEYYDSLGGKFTPESRPGPYKVSLFPDYALNLNLYLLIAR